MANLSFAIDIGGTNTKIFQKGVGLILNEPSLVAVFGKNGIFQIKAIGENAKNMIGKTDENTNVFSPIIGSDLKSVHYASEMLRYFLDKVIPKKLFRKKIEAIICLPCGLSEEEKLDFANVCYKAKIKNVKIVPSIIASALGAGKFIHTPTTYFVVDIGGNSTDIATINLSAIVKGCTVGIGGKNMDAEIAGLVAREYGTQISLQTAEKLKEEIGSLFEKDVQNMEVIGVCVDSHKPKEIIVSSDVVKEAIMPLFEKIAYAIESTINMCTPDISMDIQRNGIFFTGGVSSIGGLENFMRKRLNLIVHVFDDAYINVILGGGKLLSDDAQLRNILQEF
ncbi:MAG: rod shape-determining protein [Clostridia bacterium]